MKPLIAAIAVVAVVSIAAPEAGAQGVVMARPSGPMPVGVGSPALGSPAGPAAFTYGGYAHPPVPTAVAPYSYYDAFPFRARVYVGLGGNDFPYYGRPYGHPYDPWTWSALANYEYLTISRYGALTP